jgi:hypothetical protein
MQDDFGFTDFPPVKTGLGGCGSIEKNLNAQQDAYATTDIGRVWPMSPKKQLLFPLPFHTNRVISVKVA